MSNDARFNRKLSVAVDLFIVLSACIVCLQIFKDMYAGGDFFRQGDYLINSLVEPVRRGQMGSAIFWISDNAGIDAVQIVGALQLASVIALYVSFRQILVSLMRPELAAVFAVSPAIFVTFWLADPEGSVRKELLAFAGLSMMTAATIAKSKLRLWTGCALFVAAILSHEAMVLLVPVLFAITWRSDMRRESNWHFNLLALTIISAAIFSVIYTLLYPKVADAGSVCRPLLERGFSESFCDGAIVWVGADIRMGLETVASKLDLRSVLEVSITYLVAVFPFVWLASRQSRPAPACLVIVGTAIPFIPLYIVAIDWGRWMSLHVFSLTLIFVMAFRSGQMTLTAPIAKPLLLFFVTVAVFVSPGHVMGIQEGGAVLSLLSHLGQALMYGVRLVRGSV